MRNIKNALKNYDIMSQMTGEIFQTFSGFQFETQILFFVNGIKAFLKSDFAFSFTSFDKRPLAQNHES